MDVSTFCRNLVLIRIVFLKLFGDLLRIAALVPKNPPHPLTSKTTTHTYSIWCFHDLRVDALPERCGRNQYFTSTLTFGFHFADRRSCELINPLSCYIVCDCMPAFARVCCWLGAFIVWDQTHHRTVSQPWVQQIAVQVSVFHIGQDDHRGGVTFTLHSLQTHTWKNTSD